MNCCLLVYLLFLPSELNDSALNQHRDDCVYSMMMMMMIDVGR
jgi:hypothetical protein